jgi:ribose transport system substrate-binding protein
MHKIAVRPCHRKPRSIRGVPLALASVIAAGTLALAACSSGHADAPASAPTGTAIPRQTLAQLRAVIARAESVPAFTAPGPPVNASQARGKTALVMPVNSQIDSCNTQAEDFQALGQQLGLNVTSYTDNGVPAQWTSGIQQAATSRDNAVAELCGIEPALVGPAIQAAHQAGAVVVDGDYNETADYSGLNAETAVDIAQGATQDTDDALVNLGGQALHALVVSTDSIVQGPAARAAIAAEEKRVCPARCSAVDLVVPTQDWATQLAPEVRQELATHRDINAVIVTMDGMVQFAMPAVEQIHRLGMQIYTWGASRTVESYMLQKGSLVAADPGPNNEWDAYQEMDQVLRLLTGQPAASVSSELSPDRFWVPSNVAQFFGPDGSYGNEGYGSDAFINGFRELWGLAPVSSPVP